VANTVAFAILMVVTYVTTALNLGITKSNVEILNLADTRFSPKGTAFAIWGVIYTL